MIYDVGHTASLFKNNGRRVQPVDATYHSVFQSPRFHVVSD